jgi:hypothetical protein
MVFITGAMVDYWLTDHRDWHAYNAISVSASLYINSMTAIMANY